MELTRKCTNCSRAPQPIGEFASSKDPNVFVKRCLKCRTKDSKQKRRPDVREKRNERGRERKYYEKYRAKKREEDEDGFKEHNAEVMRSWREKNPDYQNELQKNVLSVRVSILKSSSKVRGITLDISDENLESIISGDCAYCGKVSTPGDFNGVDRLDSTDGYKLSNVVSCCQMCNFMKGSLDPITFIKRCKHISGEEDNSSSWKKGHSVGYAKYVYRAKKKNLEFDISEDFFEDSIYGYCYYCKRVPDVDETFGVDRLDNSVGYTEDNCVTACSECNYMKRSFGEREFFERCEQIAKFLKGKDFVYKGTQCLDSIVKREKIV